MHVAAVRVVLDRAPDEFLNSLPEHSLLMQVLYNRGLRTAEEASAFLAEDDAKVKELSDTLLAALDHVLEFGKSYNEAVAMKTKRSSV